MKDMQLGVLLPIFLFFVLIAGIIIIYREEIEKMELFGRLHTTPVSGTYHSDQQGRRPPPSIAPIPAIKPPAIPPVSGVSGSRSLAFGDSRVVDASFRDVSTNTLHLNSSSLHTLSLDTVSGADDYYARAFVEEAVASYGQSPHAGSVVFFDRVSSIQEIDPNREYFILLVSPVLQKPLTITGWKVSSRRGKDPYVFPNGVKVLGSDEVSLPIVVHPGNVVVVSSGVSPIGPSFQVNKCSGYRSRSFAFVPAVKTSCSDPVQEYVEYGEIPFSDDVCYDTASSLQSCVAVVDIPSGVTKECRYFFKNVLTEKGCVYRHRNDPDFLAGEWRLFLKSDRELWRGRDDVLYLFDDKDLLVATLVYK